jgi:hypothetical protein
MVGIVEGARSSAMGPPEDTLVDTCQCPCGCQMEIWTKNDGRQPKAFCYHCTAPESHRAKYIAPGLK